MPGAVGFSNRAVSAAHGAACAIGAILARLANAANYETEVSSWSILSLDALPSALSSVVDAIDHPVSLLHAAACEAIGRVGAARPLPLPSVEHGASVAAASSEITPHAQNGGDRVTTVQRVFEKLWTACRLGETTDASRRAEAAAEAVGRCCRGARYGLIDEGERSGVEGERVSARVRKTLRVLFDMAKNQVQFGVGGSAITDSICLHVVRKLVRSRERWNARA